MLFISSFCWRTSFKSRPNKFFYFAFIWGCLFPMHSWRIVSMSTAFPVGNFFFPFSSWKNINYFLASTASYENSLSPELVALTHNVSFHSGCSEYFLSLVFRSLIIMCPGIDFFGFIQFGVCSVEILRFALFTKFGKFSAITASHTPSAPFSFYFLSLSPKIWMLA